MLTGYETSSQEFSDRAGNFEASKKILKVSKMSTTLKKKKLPNMPVDVDICKDATFDWVARMFGICKDLYINFNWGKNY